MTDAEKTVADDAMVDPEIVQHNKRAITPIIPPAEV